LRRLEETVADFTAAEAEEGKEAARMVEQQITVSTYKVLIRWSRVFPRYSLQISLSLPARPLCRGV